MARAEFSEAIMVGFSSGLGKVISGGSFVRVSGSDGIWSVGSRYGIMLNSTWIWVVRSSFTFAEITSLLNPGLAMIKSLVPILVVMSHGEFWHCVWLPPKTSTTNGVGAVMEIVPRLRKLAQRKYITEIVATRASKTAKREIVSEFEDIFEVFNVWMRLVQLYGNEI